MAAYYNEIEPYAAAWLRNLIAAGHIAPGDVDERDIRDVRPDDLRGYRQCHFFAGIGGWGRALRLAGWPDDRPVWTGSCPCQPWSLAGPRTGAADDRHLWPDWFRLLRAARPAVVVGEQVADAAGRGWWDEVAADLEGIGYACRAVGVPACAVGAPHERLRLWFVADAGGPGLPLPEREALQRARRWGEGAAAARSHGWPAESGLVPVVHGVPGRVGGIKAAGNAIVPQIAAEIIGAYLDSERHRAGLALL